MPRKTLKEELIEAEQQLEMEEKQREDNSLSDQQRQLASLAADLIGLSRDMRRPGSSFSEAGRIERLLKRIKGE